MTSDPGRTRGDNDGQDQDALLLRQLLICARIGLVGAALYQRAASTDDLTELLAHFDGGVGDLARRVQRLIRSLTDAWTRMPEGRLAAAAGALLGIDLDVSAPWPQREAAAAERWAIGTRVDTFNRRARPQILAELLFRLREPKPATPQPTVWGNLPRIPKELEGGDHPTISLEIDTEISCALRQVVRSHWRRTVRPVKSGIGRLTLTTHDDTLRTVEPQTSG